MRVVTNSSFSGGDPALAADAVADLAPALGGATAVVPRVGASQGSVVGALRLQPLARGHDPDLGASLAPSLNLSGCYIGLVPCSMSLSFLWIYELTSCFQVS